MLQSPRSVFSFPADPAVPSYEPAPTFQQRPGPGPGPKSTHQLPHHEGPGFKSSQKAPNPKASAEHGGIDDDELFDVRPRNPLDDFFSRYEPSCELQHMLQHKSGWILWRTRAELSSKPSFLLPIESVQDLDIDALVSQHYSKAQPTQADGGRLSGQYSATPPAGTRPNLGQSHTQNPSHVPPFPKQGATGARSEGGYAQALPSRSPLGQASSRGAQGPQEGNPVPHSASRGFSGAEGGHVYGQDPPGDGSGITHQSPRHLPGSNRSQPEGARLLGRACSHGVKVLFCRPDGRVGAILQHAIGAGRRKS